MEDNAIIFSYDTRVNAFAFWGIIGVDALLSIAYFFFRHSKKHFVEFRLLLLTEYMVALLLLTVAFRETPVFPDDFQNTFFANKRELTGNVSAEWLVNVLMFIPIGCLLSSVIYKNRLIKTLAFAIVFSFFIETLQFWFNKGVADIEDVVCNTIGLIMGCVFWPLIKAAYNRCAKTF